jgi:hypothetical protein
MQVAEVVVLVAITVMVAMAEMLQLLHKLPGALAEQEEEL